MNIAAGFDPLLEKTLLALHESADGQALLRDIFNAEKFRAGPPHGLPRAVPRGAGESVGHLLFRRGRAHSNPVG